MQKFIANVSEKLKAGEYKLTPRRELILRVLLENGEKHLSAEEIYNLVKAKVLDVGLATVYRTLELFVELDIIRAIDFGDGRKRYEFGHGHHHHHLICEECHQIIEVGEDLLDEIENIVTWDYQFLIVNHHLIIYGICKDCMAKRKI